VKLEVFGVSGKRITDLGGQVMDRGMHAVEWNGTDLRGNSVASGVYFCRLIVGKKKMAKKMILLR
jgi:flagellar hook assembly protein FlgD